MKTLVITEPGSAGIVEQPAPVPSPGDALLRLHTVGYCGSDLNTFRGLNPLIAYPLIPGHEIGAVIEEVGEGVSPQWKTGQRVLVSPYTQCGSCTACRQGRTNCCRKNRTLGVQRNGAMAEWMVAPEDTLFTSEILNEREMALVEPLTIGHHAVDRGLITAKDTVAVFGCGAIGLGAVAAAASRKARVLAVDIDDEKLELAVQCGASHTVNSEEQSLHEALQTLTDGNGPDVAIEAVGLPATYVAAVEEVCFAGRVVYIGYAKVPVAYETKSFVLKELDILGSRNARRDDFQSVIAMLETRRFPVDAVITRTVSLDAAPAALAEWASNPGAVTKIHVRIGDR